MYRCYQTANLFLQLYSPHHYNNVIKLTKKHKADIGLSFDGDADRVIISDDKGNILRFSGLNTDQLIQISGYLNKKKFSYLNNALEKNGSLFHIGEKFVGSSL